MGDRAGSTPVGGTKIRLQIKRIFLMEELSMSLNNANIEINDFCLNSGSGHVMISAPHNVKQLRQGKLKKAEPQTGTLAIMLHKELGCPIIYKTNFCNDDANFDSRSPYKTALYEYINTSNVKFLVDLHQLSPTRKTQINLGTGYFKNTNLKFTNIFLNAFSEQLLGIIQIDSPFAAAQPNTISSYIHRKCGIDSLQIEINSNCYSESCPTVILI